MSYYESKYSPRDKRYCKCANTPGLSTCQYCRTREYIRGTGQYPTTNKKPNDLTMFGFRVGNIAAEIGNLIVDKQSDYGSKNISDAPGGAMNGLLVRMHDKFARLKHLTTKSLTPKNESIEDTLKDIAGYAIIALMVRRGLWDNEKDSTSS